MHRTVYAAPLRAPQQEGRKTKHGKTRKVNYSGQNGHLVQSNIWYTEKNTNTCLPGLNERSTVPILTVGLRLRAQLVLRLKKLDELSKLKKLNIRRILKKSTRTICFKHLGREDRGNRQVARKKYLEIVWSVRKGKTTFIGWSRGVPRCKE